MSAPPTNPLVEAHRPPFLTTNSSHDSSSAPSTLSPQSPGRALPGMSLLGPQIIHRPESAGRLSFPPTVHMPPLSEPQSRYGSDYEQMLHQDQFRLRGMLAGGSGLGSSSGAAGSVPGHKRAYRQRRKDPSCDACRERKVKCDATDTTSCSECSSRSVKCQFTKETNRRMSSIKQVQDLEKQLQEARQKVSQLQSMVKTDGMVVEDDLEPSTQPRPKKRRRMGGPQDFSVVQKNMSNFGRGLFSPPLHHNLHANSLPNKADLPKLPQWALYEELITDYQGTFHQSFPFIDISALKDGHDIAHRDWNTDTAPVEFAAVLFGVFACGSLKRHSREGQEFFQAQKSLIDFWAAQPTLDLVRAMLLCAFYLTETNEKCSAFRIIAHALRAAQDLGLHRKGGMNPSEEEGRCSLWWSLYCTERLLACELGLPSMLSDEDHSTLIEPIEDPQSSFFSPRLSLAVQVAKLVPYVRKAFKSPTAPAPVIQAIDGDLDRCMSRLPPHHQPHAIERLLPDEIAPILYVQDLRLILHRHNLNPLCPTSIRISAISECSGIARNTAQLLARVIQYSPSNMLQDGDLTRSYESESKKWEEQMHYSATTFICLHVWRCMLLLIACNDFEGALLCATVSAAIGGARPINEYCGRYSQFFLDFCSSERRRRHAPLEEDDEALAYLSGDLQGNVDQAWIWQEDDDLRTPNSPSVSIEQTALDNEGLQWKGWSALIDKLRQLFEDQKRQHQNSRQANTSNPAPKLDNAMSSPGQQQSPSNRMSIADII